MQAHPRATHSRDLSRVGAYRYISETAASSRQDQRLRDPRPAGDRAAHMSPRKDPLILVSQRDLGRHLNGRSDEERPLPMCPA